MTVALPHEFGGPRTYEEAYNDLLTIASAIEPANQAHVRFISEGDRMMTGPLTASPQGDSLEIRVDDQEAFLLTPTKFKSAWLQTLDGADYYYLRMELGDGIVRVDDAYND